MLFNAHNARGPAHDKAQIIVVEGYMDVIALCRGGLPADRGAARHGAHRGAGQAALAHGARAGAVLRRRCRRPPRRLPGGRDRAAALASPATACGSPSCPTGLDPDDLIRQHGAGRLPGRPRAQAAAAVRRPDGARGAAGQPALTPEQRAALERPPQGPRRPHRRCRRAQRNTSASCARRCGTKNRKTARDLAGYDGRRDARFAGKRRDNTALDWRVAERRPRSAAPAQRLRPRRQPGLAGGARATSSPSARRPLPAARGPADRARSSTIPGCWRPDARRSPSSALTSPPLARLRDALLELLAEQRPLDRGEVRSQLTDLGLDKVVAMAERAITHKSDRFAKPRPTPPSVESGWRHAACASRGPGWSETCARRGRAGFGRTPARRPGPHRRDPAAAGRWHRDAKTPVTA